MASIAKIFGKSDASIRDAVLAELKCDPKITSKEITVSVVDGVVTLAGFVASDIEVKLPSTRTDPEIARDAVREPESHVSIPHDKITVTVKNGWVTLEGTVEWQYQKALAESAVKKLPGVIGDTNNIAVTPRVSPSAVKEKIEEALRRSAEVLSHRSSDSGDRPLVGGGSIVFRSHAPIRSSGSDACSPDR